MKSIVVFCLTIALMLMPIIGAGCDSDGSKGDENQDGGNLLWTVMTSSTEKDLFDVWGSSSDDVFVVGWNVGEGDNNILHYDGNNWSEMDIPEVDFLQDIWGISSDDVFAVGNDAAILHYDGDIWTEMSRDYGGDLLGVWGTSSSDVFAVGESGNIMHYDGSNWSSMNQGDSYEFESVWGSTPTNVFAVGSSTILRYDGTIWTDMSSVIPWSEMDTGSHWDLWGIWGSSSTDIFIVGTVWQTESTGTGIILHYDGSEWSLMTTNTTLLFLDVWGSSFDDVFAVGWNVGEGDNNILHYNGDNWSEVDMTAVPLPHRELWGIWGSSSTDIFAVGRDGTVLHYDNPQIPELTEIERAEVKEIALNDARIQEIIHGKQYTIEDSMIGVWHATYDKGLEKIGAVLTIDFEQIYEIEYDWPTIEYDEEKYSWPYYKEMTIHQSGQVGSLTISINLDESKVVQITPLPFHQPPLS